MSITSVADHVLREETHMHTGRHLGELSDVETCTATCLEALAHTQEQTEEILQSLTVQLDRGTGKLLEMDYRDKAYAYFGTLLRRVQVISLQELEPDLESQLSEQEFQQLLPLDLLVRGQVRKAERPTEVYLAVEVSAVVDVGDVERAQRRAALLRKAGYAAIATAAGEEVTEGARKAAEDRSVLLVQDGVKRNWAAALAQVMPA